MEGSVTSRNVTFEMDLPDEAVVDQGICIVTYLDEEGNMAYGFNVAQSGTMMGVVGLLEVVKQHIFKERGL